MKDYNYYLCYHSRVIEDFEGKHGLDFQDAMKQLVSDFNKKAIVNDGIARWKKSNHIPSTEALVLWKYAGKEFDFDLTVLTKEKETEQAIEEYKKNNVFNSEEHMRELYSTFPVGTTVINVITGQVTNL